MTKDHTELRDIRLREYRPRPTVRVASHPRPRARFAAVDAHNHLGRWFAGGGRWAVDDDSALLAGMEAAGVRAIVNLDGRWGEELEANLARYDRRHPGRFVTFCHLDWAEAAAPGFGERLAENLRRSAAAGARGLKVWKDLGTEVVDDRGDLLLPDDPRLSPVWRAAAKAGLPVLIHVADPVAFFAPLDATNERLEELLENPSWSYAHLGRAHYDRLIDGLEAVAAANPDTVFIGAHVAGVAEDLDRVERMLEACPNLYVDLAARVAELGRQPRRSRELVLRHPERVLFGTDLTPPDWEEYAIAFRFLETADEHFAYSRSEPPPQGRWRVSGLELPDEVLELVYSGNALRLIPGLAE